MRERNDSKVTLLIAAKSAGAQLRRCLKSVYSGTMVPGVIVLMCGGKDEAAARIRSEFPQVTVFDFNMNPGRAHALNTGLHIARTPYVMTLSPRLLAGKHCVEALAGALDADGETAGVQAKILTAEDPSRIRGAGWNFRLSGEPYILGEGARASLYDRSTKIAAAMAEAAMYRMEALEVTGIFDERFYGRLEDADLGYRACMAGFTNRYVPEAVCREQEAERSGIFRDQLETGNRIYLQYKIRPSWLQTLVRPFTIVKETVRKYSRQPEDKESFEAAVDRGRMLCFQAEMELMERTELGMSVTKQTLPEEFCMEVPDERVKKIYPLFLGERSGGSAGDAAGMLRMLAGTTLAGAGDLFIKAGGKIF